MTRYPVISCTALAVVALTGVALAPPASAESRNGAPHPAVAVQWDGIVSIVDPFTGASRPLTSTETGGEQQHPDWSPDGTKVAFAVDDGTKDIWIADARTGVAKKVIDCTAPRCYYTDEPAWSPDGRSIAFEQVLTNGDLSVPSLQILDVATGRQRTVTTFPADFNAYTSSWSPGGRALLYELDQFASGRLDDSTVLNIRVQTVDISTGKKTTLTDPAKEAQIPDWNTRDGRIVYVQPYDLKQGFWGPLDLVVIDRTGRHLVTHLGAIGQRAFQAKWTPDGKRLVLVYEKQLYASTIAFLDPESGVLTKTATPGTHPDLRP